MKTPSTPKFDAQGTASTQANYNQQAASQSFDYNKLAGELSQKYYEEAFKNTMAQNTMGQETPYGSLSYTTSIDPITGSPKYTAKTQLSSEQQALLNTLQANQLGFGQTAGNLIDQTFGQYEGDPNLVGKAGSLTNQFLDSMIPAWERFNAPMRDQLRTQLINQGLVEGSPAYQQQMDKLVQQQQLNYEQARASFQPQAFEQARTQYQLPLENAIKMLSQSSPGSIKGNLVTTPTGTEQGATVSGVNVNPVDYSSLAKTQYESQMKAYEAQVARQNAMMGLATGAVGAVAGMPVGGNTFGGQVLKGIMGNGGMGLHNWGNMTNTVDQFGMMI